MLLEREKPDDNLKAPKTHIYTSALTVVKIKKEMALGLGPMVWYRSKMVMFRSWDCMSVKILSHLGEVV